MKSKKSIQSIVRGMLILVMASAFVAPVLVRGEVVAAPAPGPSPVVVDAPVTIKIIDDDDVAVTTDGSVTLPSPGNATVTVGTASGIPPKAIHYTGKGTVTVTGAGKVTVTAVAPGKVDFTGGIVTVSAGSAVAVTISVQALPKNALTAAKQPMSSPNFDIMIGSVTLNPFTIGSDGAGGYKLMTDNTQTSLIIMVNYASRWAWDLANTNDPEGNGQWRSAVHAHDFIDFNTYDIQARGGYTFGAGSTNASTIIGSGDLDLEFTFGKQLARMESTTFAYSLNLETEIAAVTDRQFSDSHTSVIVGPTFVTSFQGPWQSGTANRVYLFFRGGLANYEMPVFSTGLDIKTDSLGNPQFHRIWGGVMEMERVTNSARVRSSQRERAFIRRTPYRPGLYGSVIRRRLGRSREFSKVSWVVEFLRPAPLRIDPVRGREVNRDRRELIPVSERARFDWCSCL